MPSSTLSKSEPTQAHSFFINVLWNWLSVGANLFTAIFLTRYMIHKLGDQRYGVWTLVFALIEYVYLFDLGFRSAIVNFVSRFRVQDDRDGINTVINTGLFYFSCVGVVISILTVALAGQGYRLFQIAPGDRADFEFLLLLIGFTWAGAMVVCVFQASLEAFQQFKTYNHIFITTMVLRAGGTALFLYLGYQLRAIGLAVVAAQFLGYVLMFHAFRKAFPELRLARRLVSFECWKQMGKFGVNSIIASSGQLFLNQGPPLLIGHYAPTAFVGYYTLPSKLLNYAVEMISRIGFVTAPKTAELHARGRTDQIINLGIHLNRYCLSLFLPVSVFMGIFGTELISRWLGPVFAQHSGPLLPVFAISIALVMAGQFNSSSILFGIAGHGPYAVSIVVESVLSMVLIALALPHYGIFGAACIVAVLSIINRGLITPAILCRTLHYSYWRYVGGIYVRPLLTAVLLTGLAIGMKTYWISGQSWMELIIAAGVIGSCGMLLSLFTCISAEHRAMLWNILRDRVRQVRPQPAATT